MYKCQAYSQTPDPVSVQLSVFTGTRSNGVNMRVNSHRICIKSASDPNRDNFTAARHVPAAMRSRPVTQSERRVRTGSRTARAHARAFRLSAR